MTDPMTLSRVPRTHRGEAERMRVGWWVLVDDQTPLWPVLNRGRPALIALGTRRLVYVASGRGGTEFEAAYDRTTVDSQGRTVTLTGPDWKIAVELPEEDDAARFGNTFSERQAVEGCPRPAAQPAPTAASQVLIVTTNEVPGYDIVDVHGDVFGLVVRARNIFSNMGASLKGIVGGEVGGYTKLLSESRDEARERLAAETLRRGGNAVLAMRFDCNEIADVMSEVAAYGTAVTVRRTSTTLM